MNKKQQKRYIELVDKLKKCEHTTDEYLELNELQFIRNKENINFRLSGGNKYYYADQCFQFKRNLKNLLQKSNKDYDQRLLNRVENQGISFHDYSINIGYSRYNEDYKRFNSKHELLGFIVGFNNAMERAS